MLIDTSNSPLLTVKDLVELTKKQKPSAQKKALAAMRIPFIERTDGSVVLTWTAINHRLIGKEVENMPNLSALDKLD